MVVKRILRCFDLCNATAVNDEAHSNAEIRGSPNTKSATVDGQYVTIASSAMNNLLKCPVCLTLMSPPIHQCSNGHVLCSNCKAKACNICPLCRQVLGNIRCLALEKFSEKLELAWRCSNFGCQDIFPIDSKLGHEQNCRFRPYKCPFNKVECFVTGNIQFLVEHLKNNHKVEVFFRASTFNVIVADPNPNANPNPRDATRPLVVFNCLGHHFCLHVEAFNLEKTPVYMVIMRFMGNEDEAKKFTCSFEVGRNETKLTWQGVPRSICDSGKAVRDSLAGLVIQKRLAHFFSDGDGQQLKLKMVCRIWKEGTATMQ